MEIYFVRHTSVDVPSGICYGSTDVDLKSTFSEEAQEVKNRLKGLQFDKIFTSPLSRATKLASFCGYPDATIDIRLTEFNFGDWEMQSYDKLYEEEALFREWCEKYITTKCPNGESLTEQINRVDSFINDLKAIGYTRVCAFCHGGVLAIGRSLAGGITIEDTFKSIPPFGSVICCKY